MNKTLERILIASSGLVVGASVALFSLYPQHSSVQPENNAKIENVYFSPRSRCSEHLTGLINNARKSIYIEIYTFTDKRIADALISASKRGIDVRVIFDRKQASIKSSLDEYLEDNKIKIKYDRGEGIMHNKVMIIDSNIVETGSFNYTLSADEKNDENMIIINDPKTAGKYIEEFNRLWNNR